MTDEQRNAYRKVFQENKQIIQAKEGVQDAQILSTGYKKQKVAHQDEQIAHPDTMRKIPAIILLVVVLIGSFIFEQWYFIWIIALVWYFSKKRV